EKEMSRKMQGFSSLDRMQAHFSNASRSYLDFELRGETGNLNQNRCSCQHDLPTPDYEYVNLPRARTSGELLYQQKKTYTSFPAFGVPENSNGFFKNQTSPKFDHQVVNENNHFGSPCRDVGTVTTPVTESLKSSNDEKRQSIWITTLYECSGSSTLHGISNICYAGRIDLKKIVWAVVFVAAVGFFATHTLEAIQRFRERPHTTIIDELESEEPMDFPALTICNLNSNRLSKLTVDDIYHIGFINGLITKNRTYSPFLQPNTGKMLSETLKKKIAQVVNGYQSPYAQFDMFEYSDRTGHEFNSVVVDCKYRGESCKGDDFWTTVFTRHGKCLTFNNPADSENVVKTLKGGIDNGLEVLLNLEQEEYIPVWSDNDELSVEAGFKVQLHSQQEPPFLHELGFGISPGFQTLVATQEQRVKFLPPPWGVCDDNNSKEDHKYFQNYSISACRITCETKMVLAKCGCRMVHMPFLPEESPRFCQPNQWECADEELDNLTSKDNSKCVCATPCDVRRYSKDRVKNKRHFLNETFEYLSAKYAKPQNYIRKNFAKLNVFFEALNYEKIEQKKAYEFGALLGDIGGQMGLFIGGSILTLLEIFNYFHDIIKDKTRRRKPSLSSTKSVSGY
ncbi:unnamed protein product, partial [Oikopleura dioica]